MKTQTITHTYDPNTQSLNTFVDGKLRGGFAGPIGERMFNRLLQEGAAVQITNMNTEAVKKQLIRRFHASMAKQGLMEHKETILESYGVQSTLELTTDQLRELVAEYSPSERKPDNARTRTLRSELLTLCNKLGVYINNTDWTEVNQFFVRHTGKLMYQMDEQELVKARKQFNAILDWSTNKKTEIDRQKLMN